LIGNPIDSGYATLQERARTLVLLVGAAEVTRAELTRAEASVRKCILQIVEDWDGLVVGELIVTETVLEGSVVLAVVMLLE
jgi:hypothetical protein